MKKIVYLVLGHISIALGIIGALLPVMPTTPFLLLAAFFYSQSSPRLHNWMMNHKYMGPPLRDWQERGVIGIKAKIVATVAIGLVVAWRIPMLEIALWIKLVASSTLLAVLVFIWTRRSR